MKLNLALGVALAALLNVTGCSKSEPAAEGAEAKPAATSENTVTLRFSHFWPATAAMHTDVVEPWAKKLAEESNGRINVEIYPSATLSKPNATYDAVAKGTIDMGITTQGYTNGRFPLTQVAELPGLSNSASQMSCMLQKLYDDGVISSEYEDTHTLFMIGAGPSALHTIDKPVNKPEDLKGLRIRRPSEIAGNIIEIAGASPVGLPASDLYSSLDRGVIDGMALPWSPTGSFRLLELVKSHTNVPIYSSALIATMNKNQYEKLPADLKEILDKNTGTVMSTIVGEMFDREDNKFGEEAIANGDTVIDIPDPLNDPAWKGVLEKATQKYLDDVNALGLDADTVYEKAQEASIACKK